MARTADRTTAVAYIRVSTDEQNLGPEAQREALTQWAEREGVSIAAEYTDHGVSGAAPLDKRPGLLDALDALTAHGAGVLVVAKRDRLARDTMTAAMVERMAQRDGAVVRSADGVGNGDTPEAMLMRRMVDAFAEYERALIRGRTRAALAVKRARGEKTGGDVPVGFTVADDGATLVEDDREQRALALIRGLRADGVSIRKIAAALDASGIPARGKRWHPTTVSRLLSRDVA